MRAYSPCVLFFSVVCFAVASAIGVWVLWPRTAINQANFACIHNGMTMEEVDPILGGPPRDETTGPTTVDGDLPDELGDGNGWVSTADHFDKDGRRDFARRAWTADRLSVLVDFDATARVCGKHVIQLRRDEESVFGRLRRWLRL
jgi:hypothetical protein